MLIKEYECKQCNLEIKILQKMDEKLPNCPVCGRSMVKLISSTSFILNGRNWDTVSSGSYSSSTCGNHTVMNGVLSTIVPFSSDQSELLLNGKNWEKDGYGLRSKKKGESK